MERVILAWSGGKDSTMSLYEIEKGKNYEVVSLLTTVTKDYDRVSMHGVRRILIEQQAESLGLPIEEMFISKDSSNEEYESKMREVLTREYANGVTAVAFGDIFLEDIRRYREEKLSQVGMRAIFPIWKRDTRELAVGFIDAAFQAILTCVDSKQLDGSRLLKCSVGREDSFFTCAINGCCSSD